MAFGGIDAAVFASCVGGAHAGEMIMRENPAREHYRTFPSLTGDSLGGWGDGIVAP
jgi:hypothetical protein